MRVFQELREAGYPGGHEVVERHVRRVYPQPGKEPMVRFETVLGQQGCVPQRARVSGKESLWGMIDKRPCSPTRSCPSARVPECSRAGSGLPPTPHPHGGPHRGPEQRMNAHKPNGINALRL